MIDYFQRVQMLCMMSQGNPVLMHNPILKTVLSETQKYIAQANEFDSMQKKINEIQLTETEQNLTKSFWLLMQSKLGINQQTGQQIGKIDPVKAPFQMTAQGLLFGGGK